MYLSLRGRIYTSNNTYIDIDDIGVGDEAALLCITDLMQCCRASELNIALERWFYPNGLFQLIRIYIPPWKIIIMAVFRGVLVNFNWILKGFFCWKTITS